MGIGGFSPGFEDGARDKTAQGLGRGLLFEGFDLVQPPAGRIIVAFEQIQRNQRGEQSAFGGGVVDLVIAQHGLHVRADLSGKRAEGLFGAHEIFDLSADGVLELRDVGRTCDLFLGRLGKDEGRNQETSESRNESCAHELS